MSRGHHGDTRPERPSRGPILLHTCCGPCATSPVVRLRREGYEVILYFSNSNINPPAEYRLRLLNARILADTLELSLLSDDYDHQAWLEHVAGLEHEPERGRRCLQCFDFNLDRTAAAARRLGIAAFTTTLTVSRHKPSAEIFRIGEKYPGFTPIDFKKKNGYHESIVLSRRYNLYRQRYCGCEFSRPAP